MFLFVSFRIIKQKRNECEKIKELVMCALPLKFPLANILFCPSRLQRCIDRTCKPLILVRLVGLNDCCSVTSLYTRSVLRPLEVIL